MPLSVFIDSTAVTLPFVRQSGKPGSERVTRAARQAFDESVSRQILVSLVAIKIAGLILIFDVAGLLSFELPKALFSRAMEWLIAGTLLITVLRYGPGIMPRTRLHLAVGAIVLVNALSTLFAENRYIALFGDEDHYLGFTYIVDMAVLYLAVAAAFRRLADWALFGGILAFVTAVVLGYASLQYRGLDPLRWNVDPQSSTFSTLGDADTLGRYLSLTFGASIGLAALGRGDAAPAVRLAAAVVALVVLAAAALSTVRGTLLGLAAILAFLPFVYLRMRGGARQDVAFAAIGAAAIVALLAVLLALTPVGAKAQSVLRDPGTAIRLGLFDTALRALSDRPLLGYGPDNFAVAYPRYRQPGGTTVGILDHDAHNWFFQTAATTGGLGLLALVVAIVLSVLQLWTTLRGQAGSLAALVLLASVGYWVQASTTIASVGIDWFPYLALGAVATMGQRPGFSSTAIPNVRSVAMVALVAVVAAAGSLTGIFAFQANRDVAVAAGQKNARPDVAIAAAEFAIRGDPGRAIYWYWLGRAADARQDWVRSAAAYREAASRSPYEPTYWTHLAESLVREAQRRGEPGLSSAAIAAARKATEVDPNDPVSHAALAETTYTLGDYELSLHAAVRAIELWPAGNNDALAARAALRVSDLTQARALLETAVRLRDTAVLHLALGQVALKLNDRETARAHAKRTLELAPGDRDAQNILTAIGD